MGRKIPAKKHRGVKDPLVQQARRVQSLQNKINAPPTDPDDQPVPSTLTRLFAFQNKKQDIVPKKKKNKKQILNKASPSNNGRHNPVSSLRRLAGEGGRAFSLRINSAMKTLNAPDNYDYMEDMETEDIKGDAMAERREKRARKRARRGGAGAARGAGVVGAAAGGAGDARGQQLTRGQKLTLRNKARKLKLAERSASSAPQYERVSFGEVAAAPPALPAPRRAPDNKHCARRGLLLYGMLGAEAAGGAAGVAGGAAGVARGAADAERRERARLEAVAAYRALRRRKAHS